MEFLAAVLSPVLEYTIKPFMRHVSYPFNWKTNVGDLEERVKALKDAKERLEDKKEAERRNGKEIYGNVNEWLNKADEIVEKESEELVQAKEKAKTKCLFGIFPDLIKRYHVSRKAEKKAGDVAKLLQKKFSTIARAAPLSSTEALSAGDYEALDSRILVLEQIKSALTEVDVRMVGVHGIGGMGKTTLAKEVARQTKEEDLFDTVIFVTVTIAVNVEKIQDQIADQLGLKFDEKSVEGRASRLSWRLKQEKKLLLILDDLWKALDLGAVGIPPNNQHTGCKMLLTSRDLQVLSNGMDCPMDYNFAVGALPENEAWNLFEKMAGTNFDNDDRHSIAVEVCKVCAGLPIAIVTMARTLKDKNSLREWRNALKELKRPPIGNFSKIHCTIKFSYDNLETEDLKSIFLHCSQMGYNATTRDLLKYGIGLDLFHNDFTLEEAQDTLFSLLNRLKALCLLIEGTMTEEIVMHDVVRETGRMIASSNHRVLIIEDDENMRNVLVDEDRLKGKRAIWVHSKVNQLPQKMECPELLLFHVNGEGVDVQVPDKLFEDLNKLKVLSLSSLSFSFLPSSLVLLENLKTLYFHELSELRDIRIIGMLKKLEVLSFANSMIIELPKEIGELTRLKLLDLSNCDKLEVIAPNVLSRLSQLEELYMYNSFHNWDIEGCRAASLFELKDLSSLTTLEIGIPDVKLARQEIFSNKLCRYKIFIGFCWFSPFSYTFREYDIYKMSKTLLLDLKETSIIRIDYRIMQLMKESEELYLHGLKDVKNFGYELDRDGFPRLKRLNLYDSPEIQYIVETMEVAPSLTLPMLEVLELRRLISLVSLEKIRCKDSMPSIFSRLRIIKVSACDRMTRLFSFFVVQSLSQLQEIEVYNCNSIEEIISGEGESSHSVELSQLQHLTLWNLPKLTSFCCKDTCGRELNLLETDTKEKKMSLFNHKILFPNLKQLSLEAIGNIEMLWQGQLPPIDHKSFQSLTLLRINRCQSLKYVFSYSLITCLAQLRTMMIMDCPEMEEVIEGMEEGSGEEQRILFPKLKILWLWNLPKFRKFCKVYLFECPSLKELHIGKCKKLETFVSQEHQEVKADGNITPTKALFNERVLFPNLVDLTIEEMGNVEKIFEVEGSSTNHAKEITFSELRSVEIRDCRVLKNVFPWCIAKTLLKLEKLKVSDCGDPEIVGKRDSEVGDDASSCLVWPKLKELHVPNNLSFFQKVKCNFEISALVVPDVIATDLLQLDFPDVRIKALKLKKFDLDDGIPLGFLQKCYNLEGLHLRGIEFKDDSIVEELFFCDGVVPEMLPQLKHLHLKALPNLRHLLVVNHAHVFPHLETLQLRKCCHLVNIAPSFASFRNLTSLSIRYCHELSSLITVQTAKSLCQLVKFEIKCCEMLTEIIVNEGDEMENEELIFTKLQSLLLDRLGSLTNFCSGNHRLNFPSLDEVIVLGCPSMKAFSTGLSSTPRLRRVRLSKYKNKQTRWEGDLNSTIQQLYNDMVRFECVDYLKLSDFPDLKGKWNDPLLPLKRFDWLERLVVDDCSFFLYAVPSHLLPRLNWLQQLDVRNCDSMESVFDLESLNADEDSHVRLLPYLIKLCLGDLPRLQHLCNNNPKGILKFRTLVTLRIHNCKSLRHVFTTPMALGLVELQKIEIRNCVMLEEIVNNEGEEEAETHDQAALLPKLTDIVLDSLPTLVTINSGNGILEFSSLKEITIKDCPSMRSFVSCLLMDQVPEIVPRGKEPRLGIDQQNLNIQTSSSSSSLSNNKVAFPCLEILRLEWNDIIEQIAEGSLVDPEFFSKLKVLELINFPNHHIPLSSPFLQKFPNLQSLVVTNALFEEIITHDEMMGEDQNARLLENLRALKLSKLAKLEHLTKEESILCSIFQRSETLEVLECNTIEILFPSSVSLQNLKILNITKCDRLLHLMTSTVARSLEQLTRMSISECRRIEQIIVPNEGKPAEDTVTFHKFKTLELHCLPNLIGFSLCNCDLMFPSLKEVVVEECCKMEIFSMGVTATPTLNKVWLTKAKNRKRWEESLNATIQKLYEDMHMMRNIDQIAMPSTSTSINKTCQ